MNNKTVYIPSFIALTNILLIIGLILFGNYNKENSLNGVWVESENQDYRLLISGDEAYFQTAFVYSSDSVPISGYLDSLLLKRKPSSQNFQVEKVLGLSSGVYDEEDKENFAQISQKYKISYKHKGDQLILHLNFKEGNKFAQSFRRNYSISDVYDEDIEELTITFKKQVKGEDE